MCGVGCWPVGVSGVGGYGAVSSYKYGVLGEAVLAGERSNSSYTLQQGCRVGHSISLYTTGLATVHGCTLYMAVHYAWLYSTLHMAVQSCRQLLPTVSLLQAALATFYRLGQSMLKEICNTWSSTSWYTGTCHRILQHCGARHCSLSTTPWRAAP